MWGAMVCIVCPLGAMTMGDDHADQKVAIGKPAPAFTLTDAAGKEHKLADYKGKIVVLQWTNHTCPFIKYHEGKAKTMQTTCNAFEGKDVVWLAIDSTKPDHAGGYTDDMIKRWKNSDGVKLPYAVLRDADVLSLAGIEKGINAVGTRARDGKLGIADMQGGTFTITNGGVYGSLMSTPILNAPQSGILGMHAIQQRPMAVDGEMVIRPMMYLALSYDHRVVDGKGAVTFLVRVKECLEDPQRMVLDL